MFSPSSKFVIEVVCATTWIHIADIPAFHDGDIQQTVFYRNIQPVSCVQTVVLSQRHLQLLMFAVGECDTNIIYVVGFTLCGMPPPHTFGAVTCLGVAVCHRHLFDMSGGMV